MKKYYVGYLVIALLIGVGFNRQEPLYSVIVVGGDPEGISAAVSSARQGERVLLIDKRRYLGGLYTSGMLSMLDLNYLENGSTAIINEGFFKEFYDSIAESANIDIERTKIYFQELLQEEGVDVVLEAAKILPLKQGRKVTGISYTKAGKSYRLPAKVVIDNSIDADFSRKASVNYKVGREDMGVGRVCAATTLVFSVKGVEWSKVKSYLNGDDSVHTGANDRVAWGYPEMLTYKATSEAFQLRRLNMSLQDNGDVVINAFQIFDVNPLDEKDIKENYERAKSELPHIVAFLRETAVGFERAMLSGYADELYIREGVRIVGEYTLTGEDVFNNRDFEDKVAYGSYPTDLQATKKDGIGGTILTSRNLYTIPISIIVPQKVGGLLVVGRSASYDSIAHSSARTVPVGMAMGQAAGILASHAITQNISLKKASREDDHIRVIQRKLIEAGVTLNTVINENQEEKKSWAYPHIISLRKRGFLSKEYKNKNDYRCTEVAEKKTLERIFELIHANSSMRWPHLEDIIKNNGPLKRQDIIQVINATLSTDYKDLHQIHAKNIISKETLEKIKLKEILLNEDVYAVMNELINYKNS